MAEGMAAMVEEAMEAAIAHFDFVLSLQEELDDRFLLAIAYYWKGRCLRRRGEYDEALIYTGKGKDLALELNHPRMAAVMQVLESWLLFQQGKWKEAVRLSQAAESVLRETDDYVTLGNIQSFYGRMARREGRFDKAIDVLRERDSLLWQARSAAPEPGAIAGQYGARQARDRAAVAETDRPRRPAPPEDAGQRRRQAQRTPVMTIAVD